MIYQYHAGAWNQVKIYGLLRVITMTLNALNEGGDVVIVRHGGCEGGKERKGEN